MHKTKCTALAALSTPMNLMSCSSVPPRCRPGGLHALAESTMPRNPRPAATPAGEDAGEAPPSPSRKPMMPPPALEPRRSPAALPGASVLGGLSAGKEA